MNTATQARKMYITYKSRINAAERLKRTNAFIQGINIYYSLFLTVLSIYSISTGTQRLSLVITVYSVVVTVTIVFLAAQNYGERAKSLKNNYVAIFKLYNKIYDGMSQNELRAICEEYDQLIDSSENHMEYDYFKACKGIPEEKPKLSIRQKIVLNSIYYGSILLKIILIALPFMLKYIVAVLEWLIKI